MSRISHVSAPLAILMVVSVLLAVPAGGQEIRTTLFADADVLMTEGKGVRADVLSPKSWGKAMELYSSAERKLESGKNLDEIRKELDQAAGYFRDAIKAVEIAKVTLPAALKARDDAAKVDAARNASKLWSEGVSKFAEAGRKLEEGNVNDARKKGAEAESLFREAELSAIKTSVFDETRKLLEQADQEKVEKFSPVTLAKSRSLLVEAEAVLNENRYDNDRPRSLAMEAKYEALHALHLAKMVKMADDEVITLEELILEAEKPLTRIAGTLNVRAGFEEGFTKPTEAIITAIEARDAEMDRLANDVSDCDARLAGMTEQVTQLEAQLGGASEVQKNLEAQVEAQELARRRFGQVELMFTREEARILRERGDVVIRLVGMNFASGQAIIRTDHYALLTKVKDAIAIYPDAMISIEGHTDAYGTDENNLKLSQLRADAVAQYLLANSNLSSSNVRAMGYGEASPIANNETKEGRALNRRIDVVINPAK